MVKKVEISGKRAIGEEVDTVFEYTSVEICLEAAIYI